MGRGGAAFMQFNKEVLTNPQCKERYAIIIIINLLDGYSLFFYYKMKINIHHE